MDNFIKDYFEQIGYSLDDNQITNFNKYNDLLIQWNKVMNLTGITEYKEVVIKHFADSIMPLLHHNFDNKSVIDVGTGAGFPGLPLKIANNSIKLTLLDSLNKRLNFLKEVCSSCDINCQLIHGRAEEVSRNKLHRERYDIAISRAVAPINILSEYLLPFVKPGGKMIALKGPNVYEELKNGERAIKNLGGKLTLVKEITLPETELNHTLVFIEKIYNTPNKYPRQNNKIERNPL